MGIQGNIYKRWEYRAILIKDENTEHIYKRWEYRAIFIKDGNTGQYLWKIGIQGNRERNFWKRKIWEKNYLFLLNERFLGTTFKKTMVSYWKNEKGGK